MTKLDGWRDSTVAVLDEIIEALVAAVVGELVVPGRKLLEALWRYVGEVPRWLRVGRDDHRPPRYEAVDQRFLPHSRLPLASPGLRLTLRAFTALEFSWGDQKNKKKRRYERRLLEKLERCEEEEEEEEKGQMEKLQRSEEEEEEEEEVFGEAAEERFSSLLRRFPPPTFHKGCFRNYIQEGQRSPPPKNVATRWVRSTLNASKHLPSRWTTSASPLPTFAGARWDPHVCDHQTKKPI